LGALIGIALGIRFFRMAYALASGSAAGLVDAPCSTPPQWCPWPCW